MLLFAVSIQGGSFSSETRACHHPIGLELTIRPTPIHPVARPNVSDRPIYIYIHVDTRRVIQSDVKGLLSAPSIKSIIFVSPLPLAIADGSVPRPHHRENSRAKIVGVMESLRLQTNSRFRGENKI